MSEQKKDFQITQIPEAAHAQAMVTLNAERQELLISRQYIDKLTQALEEGRVINERLKADVANMKEERAISETIIQELNIKLDTNKESVVEADITETTS